MREIWIDGFGLNPGPLTPLHLARMRQSMHNVADDDEYWEALQKLSQLKTELSELIKSLKREPTIPPRL